MLYHCLTMTFLMSRLAPQEELDPLAARKAARKKRLLEQAGIMPNDAAAMTQEDQEKYTVSFLADAQKLRDEVVAEMQENAAGNDETAKVGGQTVSSDYAEFVRGQAGLAKHLQGGIPWYRPDLSFRMWLMKKRFQQYAESLGIRKKGKIQRLVESLGFDLFFGLMICVNAYTIGAGAKYKDGEPKPEGVKFSENFFTGLFVGEFLLRVRAYGVVWMFDTWNFMDLLLVWITGVLTLWVLEPAGLGHPILRGLVVFRIFRLIRVARELRMVPIFKELWMLVQGMFGSLTLILWILVVGAVLLVFFSIFFMDMLGATLLYQGAPLGQSFCGQGPEYKDFCWRYFASMGGSMYTMLQFTLLDHWSYLARYFIDAPQYENKEVFLFCLLVYVVFTAIVFLNLISGIVIQLAFAASEKDAEATKVRQELVVQKTTAELLLIFDDMDKDGSGELTKVEFANLMSDAKFINKMKILDIETHDLPDVFRICDDGDGAVSSSEFCNGLVNMLKAPTALDMLSVTRTARALERTLNYIVDELSQGVLRGRVVKISDNVRGIQNGVTAFLEGAEELISSIHECDIQKICDRTQGFLPKKPELPDLKDAEAEDYGTHEFDPHNLHDRDFPKHDPKNFTKAMNYFRGRNAQEEARLARLAARRGGRGGSKRSSSVGSDSAPKRKPKRGSKEKKESKDAGGGDEAAAAAASAQSTNKTAPEEEEFSAIPPEPVIIPQPLIPAQNALMQMLGFPGKETKKEKAPEEKKTVSKTKKKVAAKDKLPPPS
ncbi:unnamed protein product [Amoebophrya sp. A25]|nr:unnamed protein product [Amoebophrya sp. A25]|eukprot:GSA25T00023084001.1